MDFKITTYSEEETIELAQNIESEKFPNMVICLRGDLGSGKTVFTKGFAQALEVKEEVTSPTFTIIKEYTSGEMPLYHMDVYRLDGKVDDLGIEEYYNKKGITIIEWADMIEDYLPDKRLDIRIKNSSEDEDKRIITITPHGRKYEELCDAILLKFYIYILHLVFYSLQYMKITQLFQRIIFYVTIASEVHLFPSRTQKLSH